MKKQKQENEEQLAYVEKIDSALKAWVEDGEKDGIMRAYFIVASEKTDEVDDEGNGMCRSMFSVVNRGGMIQDAMIAAMEEEENIRHLINVISISSFGDMFVQALAAKGGKK